MWTDGSRRPDDFGIPPPVGHGLTAADGPSARNDDAVVPRGYTVMAKEVDTAAATCRVPRRPVSTTALPVDVTGTSTSNPSACERQHSINGDCVGDAACTDGLPLSSAYNRSVHESGTSQIFPHAPARSTDAWVSTRSDGAKATVPIFSRPSQPGNVEAYVGPP
jgi:hypothetical protein